MEGTCPTDVMELQIAHFPALLAVVTVSYFGLGKLTSAKAIWGALPYITPASGKNPRENLYSDDYVFILINCAITTMYMYHFRLFIMSTPSVTWYAHTKAKLGRGRGRGRGRGACTLPLRGRPTPFPIVPQGSGRCYVVEHARVHAPPAGRL